MSTDEKNAKLKKMLEELKEYIDQLNSTLQNGCRDHISESKVHYEDIILLAGELDDYLKQ